MHITRGVFNQDTQQIEMFTIEVDEGIPIHHQKMQADEVRLALHNKINNGKHPPQAESWADKEAGKLMDLRIRAEILAHQRVIMNRLAPAFMGGAMAIGQVGVMSKSAAHTMVNLSKEYNAVTGELETV